ncbi:aminotransferase class V-fold PLP-dependent enzyme [Alsobacter sp. SYSU M60028]|uniref:Aminotransferase class V-fold PLP-dependent enzyme n=1 Tax=Alsobacter ponti TaxID=2962936 RepID=A0ABT1L7S5_9HYPH|nr:aminotransferase class V-fold PLP-dependent enzyme [Alsobacter ponti]MCP8937477.1 aminotransferase class V-fold PLP-dependent enzyme [Alsobacter ponti]
MTFQGQTQHDANPDIRVSLGCTPVINLTGTLTTLGGISARPEAIAAAAAIMGRGVDIVELQARASRAIAEVTGAEAGFVAACSSAGICMAVAGAMTGDRMTAIEQLPDTTGMKNEVVIQVGHLVNYGHPITQDIRLAGARVRAFGSVNSTSQEQLAGAIGPDTAAALFVVSHHCAPDGQIPFADFARVCRERGVPVIVDLAAEYDLTGYHKAGADICIHSAHKFVGGATAGIVSGRKDVVRAAFLQNYGIGRPMKVGKEGIAAAIVALRAFKAEDRAAVRAELQKPLLYWRDAVADIAGISAELDPDPTDNPFDRLRVTVLPDAGFKAVDVVHALEKGSPSIRVRTHQLEHGSFVMDPRSLGQGERDVVAERLRAAIGEARTNRGEGVQAWKIERANALRHWPDTQSEAAS